MTTVRSLKIASTSAAQTKRIGAGIGSTLDVGSVVLFQANLGSGKTTMVQGLIRQLGVSEAALSPTFIVAQTFHATKKRKSVALHHLDFYRLKKSEILDLGIQDYVCGGGEIERGILLIEWAERCKEIWPDDYLHVRIAIRPRSAIRDIALSARGPISLSQLQQLRKIL